LVFVGQATSEKPPEFRQALPGWRFAFPRDHRVHREFKTEWWYYTGHLEDPEGKTYGYQLTFFRAGLIPGRIKPQGSRWRAQEVFMAHLAITDIDNKTFSVQEKASRGNLGLAGADEETYHVWVETWKVKGQGPQHHLTAGDEDLSIDLTVTPTRPPVIHGSQGVSQKGALPGQASHYYSLTRLETKGVLNIKGQAVPVSGMSWMDHEFGSNQLQADQVGWDWFSIQLNNGMDLMIYHIRHKDGRVDPNSSGTLVLADSRIRHLPLSGFNLRTLGFWTSPHSQATYPASWEIVLPQEDMRLELVPLAADQELRTPKSTRVTYWEGAVKVNGTVKGKPVEGRGYVELTGYEKRFRPKI
jgi:predicted secreted hydrolase